MKFPAMYFESLIRQKSSEMKLFSSCFGKHSSYDLAREVFLGSSLTRYYG